jgi:hypothetical protein
MHAYLLIVF